MKNVFWPLFTPGPQSLTVFCGAHSSHLNRQAPLNVSTCEQSLNPNLLGRCRSSTKNIGIHTLYFTSDTSNQELKKSLESKLQTLSEQEPAHWQSPSSLHIEACHTYWSLLHNVKFTYWSLLHIILLYIHIAAQC